jgi:signal transduction histidine kinase/CheY-like chemotaxis protein
MKTILVVDDNPQNSYMLEVLLKTNGFEVVQASNGEEALELAHRNPPDLVISDILMPIMDGFRLCRAWKADEILAQTPFIFYTATYTDPKDEAFALSLGAERFLVKPMIPDDLLVVIEEVFRINPAEKEVVVAEPARKEEDYYKVYSGVLIHKLEDKMLQLELANKRLASLYKASCKLITIKSIEDLIDNVLGAVTETTDFKQAIYYQFDESQNRLSILDAVGVPPESIAAYKDLLVFSPGEERGVVGLAAHSKKMIRIKDTSREPGWIYQDTAINSALFIPVLYEDSVLGVIAFLSPGKDFSEEVELNISALVNSLAININNRKVEEKIHQLNRQLEKSLVERTALLETSNKELEAFAYSVSHDLRAPLRAVDGFAQILLEDHAEQLDPEGRRLLGIVRDNVKKMDRLIIDLLALSRVSRSELKRSRINMIAMVNSVYAEIASPEVKKIFKFEVSPLPDAYGDPTLIHQVWSNLISNAIKYSLPKGERIIKVKCSLEGDLNIYSIQDNGVGFDPQYASKLFGVFQRLHDPNRFEGTGVGLAIVQRIIQRHGGRIWADGKIDQGAKFSFTLG